MHLVLMPLPAAHAEDMLLRPASAVPYGYAWDYPPPPPPLQQGGIWPSYGTVSVSYSSAMADSEAGSRLLSYD